MPTPSITTIPSHFNIPLVLVQETVWGRGHAGGQIGLPAAGQWLRLRDVPADGRQRRRYGTQAVVFPARRHPLQKTAGGCRAVEGEVGRL